MDLKNVATALQKSDALLEMLNGVELPMGVSDCIAELKKARGLWPEVNLGSVGGLVHAVLGLPRALEIGRTLDLELPSHPSDEFFLLREIEAHAAPRGDDMDAEVDATQLLLTLWENHPPGYARPGRGEKWVAVAKPGTCKAWQAYGPRQQIYLRVVNSGNCDAVLTGLDVRGYILAR